MEIYNGEIYLEPEEDVFAEMASPFELSMGNIAKLNREVLETWRRLQEEKSEVDVISGVEQFRIRPLEEHFERTNIVFHNILSEFIGMELDSVYGADDVFSRINDGRNRWP